MDAILISMGVGLVIILAYLVIDEIKYRRAWKKAGSIMAAQHLGFLKEKNRRIRDGH